MHSPAGVRKIKFIEYMVAQPPVTGMKYEHQNWDTNVIHYIIISDCYLKAETKSMKVFCCCPMQHDFVRGTHTLTPYQRKPVRDIT